MNGKHLCPTEPLLQAVKEMLAHVDHSTRHHVEAGGLFHGEHEGAYLQAVREAVEREERTVHYADAA